jgi:hypothetical protein
MSDSPKDFAALVLKMRLAQRRYFNPNTRTQEVLRESKRLEKDVDRRLADMTRDAVQPSLFGGDS